MHTFEASTSYVLIVSQNILFPQAPFDRILIIHFSEPSGFYIKRLEILGIVGSTGRGRKGSREECEVRFRKYERLMRPWSCSVA